MIELEGITEVTWLRDDKIIKVKGKVIIQGDMVIIDCGDKKHYVFKRRIVDMCSAWDTVAKND